MEVKKRRRRRRAALIGLVPAAAAVAYGSTRSALQIDAPALLSSYLYATVSDGPANAKAAFATRTKNATECGWVDGEPVPVKPFGIVVYSGAKQNQRRRRRLQAIAGGSLLGRKKTIVIGGGGGSQQHHQGKSPIDRRGKSDGVERIEYASGDPIHFTSSNGFRRYRTDNGTSSSAPDECRRSPSDPRRRILHYIPGNCHWGNYWHLMTECLHSLAHVMLTHNVTDDDDVHLLIDVAPGAGQLSRGASYTTDWAGQYIHGCRGVGQTPWNCSLDIGEEKKQWWEIMYTPSILKRRAVGLDLMNIMLRPPSLEPGGEMNRLHLYNSKTKESDDARGIDLLADAVISGYGRLDVPGLTHNENSPEAFHYARRRILAAALRVSAAAESGKTDQIIEKPNKRKGELKKALYVSREHAAQRKVSNEAELLLKLKAVLYQAGFELKVIHQEKLSVVEQVAAWNAVDLAIVERGAGMFNALFLRNGTALVYASNGGAHDTWTWLLPVPEAGIYKVFPVNALPDCTNFAATCYAHISTYAGAVVNATRYLLYS